MDSLDNKKNNKKIVTIIILSIGLICIIVGFVLFMLNGNNSNSSNNSNSNSTNNNANNSNSSNNSNSDSTNNNANNDDSDIISSNVVGGNNNLNETSEEKVARQISNVTSELKCGLGGFAKKCILYVTNNNSETINLVIREIKLLDENGKWVGGANGPIYSNGLGSGKTGYIDIYNMMLLKEYKTYEVDYYLQTWFESDDKRDFIDISSSDNKDKKQIDIVAKNNSDKTISTIVTYVFYYKNNELIGIERANIDDDVNGNSVPRESGGQAIINSGDTVYGSADYPTGERYNDILDFDRYEVKIHEAYSSVDKMR